MMILISGVCERGWEAAVHKRSVLNDPFVFSKSPILFIFLVGSCKSVPSPFVHSFRLSAPRKTWRTICLLWKASCLPRHWQVLLWAAACPSRPSRPSRPRRTIAMHCSRPASRRSSTRVSESGSCSPRRANTFPPSYHSRSSPSNQRSERTRSDKSGPLAPCPRLRRLLRLCRQRRICTTRWPQRRLQ